jgi:parvulin-like peptidyl-prolyl isomerase
MRPLIIICLFALFSLGCNPQPQSSDPIARVNGQDITVRDYLYVLETLKPKDLGLTPDEKTKMRNLVLKTLIRRQVILSEAEAKNIKLTEAELQSGLDRYKAGYTTMSFEQSLLEQMVDQASWEERVKQSLLIEKLFEESKPSIPSPTLEEALEYYQNNRSLFVRNASVKALHIVVSTEEIAQDLRRRILKRPADFVALAREYSTGPEAQKGAVIEVEKDMMPEEIDSVLFSVKEGTLSPVVTSPYGFHLFRVISRRQALNEDFSQVRSSIIQRLTQENRRDWLLRFEERLIRAAEIEYNRELIAKL